MKYRECSSLTQNLPWSKEQGQEDQYSWAFLQESTSLLFWLGVRKQFALLSSCLTSSGECASMAQAQALVLATLQPICRAQNLWVGSSPLWSTMINAYHETQKLTNLGFHFLFLDLQDVIFFFFFNFWKLLSVTSRGVGLFFELNT